MPATADSLLLANNACNYTVFRKDRITDTHGGGVCLIVNHSAVKCVSVAIDSLFNDLDIICIDIVSTNNPVRLIAGYRPPSSDTAAEALTFTKNFINCLSMLCNVDSSIVLLGDFNFPSIDWTNLQFIIDSNRCSTLFSIFASQFCFEQLVPEPTRITLGGKSSLLDLVLCNDRIIVCDVNVVEPFSTSDHCAVNFKINCPSKSAIMPAHELRSFSDADWVTISGFLNNCDWCDVFNDCNSADDCSCAFYKKLNEAISNFVPLKRFKQTKTNKHYNYPLHIRKLYRAKAAAWRRYKQFKTQTLHRQYNLISSRCRKAVYAHVAKHEEKLINSGNIGKFFRYANSKFSHKPSIGPLRDALGNKTMDPQVKAKLLSQFFQSQFTSDNGVLPGMQPQSTGPGLSSIVFTPNLISRTIHKLSHRSAGGPDGIPPTFYKNVCPSICQPLAFLFQIIFDEGHVPLIWRKAFITSIHKKGDSTLPSNYRPISLTCCMCKLMESIIKDQLTSYLLLKGLISKHQHAFIKRHSTVTNLLECTHDWAAAVHGGNDVDVIYIDFSKAFDSVVHTKLVFKLSNYGVCGKLLQWINAFLTNRFQCAVIEHCFSEWLPVISGVPQGSVLGPILFILFVDDVMQICESSSVTLKLFADDLKLFTSIKTNLDMPALQSTLGRLQQWCADWQLTINTTKCHVLHLGKNNINPPYFLNGCQIGASQDVTDLGVDIDSCLKYNLHINKIIGKAYCRVGVVFKCFATRSVRVLRQAFITYVRPILEYASSVWSPHLLKHINAIEKIQKKFTKRIPRLSHLAYPERLAAIGLEPLELRRLKTDLIMYYKILHDLIALPANVYFNQQQYFSQTRTGGNRLIVTRCNTDRFRNDFFNRCLNCYNNLPPHVVNASSLTRFKNLLSITDLSFYLYCSYF